MCQISTRCVEYTCCGGARRFIASARGQKGGEAHGFARHGRGMMSLRGGRRPAATAVFCGVEHHGYNMSTWSSERCTDDVAVGEVPSGRGLHRVRRRACQGLVASSLRRCRCSHAKPSGGGPRRPGCSCPPVSSCSARPQHAARPTERRWKLRRLFDDQGSGVRRFVGRGRPLVARARRRVRPPWPRGPERRMRAIADSTTTPGGEALGAFC